MNHSNEGGNAVKKIILVSVAALAVAGSLWMFGCSGNRAKDLQTAKGYMREIEDAKAKMLGTMADGGCGVVCAKQQEVCLAKNEVCALADNYRGDVEFGKMCGNASSDCKLAQARCNGCRATQ